MILPHLEAGKSKTKVPANPWMGRACLQAQRWPSSLLNGRSGQGPFWGLFYKGANPIHKGSILPSGLITSQRLYLQIPSPWGLALNIQILEGHIQSTLHSFSFPETGSSPQLCGIVWRSCRVPFAWDQRYEGQDQWQGSRTGNGRQASEIRAQQEDRRRDK